MERGPGSYNGVYQFLMSAVTNYHKMCGSKQRKCILMALETGSPKSSMAEPCSLLRHQGRTQSYYIHILMAAGIPWPWLHPSILSLYLNVAFTPSPCATLLCVSLRRTLCGCRAHPDNPGRSHLEILSLIISAKTPFPNKVALTASRGRIWTHLFFWGGGYHSANHAAPGKVCFDKKNEERVIFFPFVL